jgi:N-carbamoylputrescine amidase
MIDEVRVAVVQMASKQAIYEPKTRSRNVERIVEKIKQLGKTNDLLVFPELCTTSYIPLSYSPEYKIKFWNLSEDLDNSPIVQEILKATKEIDCLCIFGFAERSRIKYEVFDSAALVALGKIIGVYRKVHLACEENHYFIPGNETVTFKTKIGTIGIGICYDMVFPESARILALKGSEITIFISSWGTVGNIKFYGRFLPVARALENQTYVIFCNDVGEIEWKGRRSKHYGESKIISPTGEIVAESVTDQEEVITGILKRTDLEKGVSILPVFRDRRPDVYNPLIEPYC